MCNFYDSEMYGEGLPHFEAAPSSMKTYSGNLMGSSIDSIHTSQAQNSYPQ